MQNPQATLTATFREGTLFLIENSTNLAINPGDRPIVDYLNALVQRGWRITQAVFEGFTLRLELEEMKPDPNPNAPVFLFHSFCIATYGLPGEQNYNSSTIEQKALSEKFKEAVRADGWQELCTSNVLRTSGYWILSLWMR
jgi:hypothetical protein